MEGLEQEFNSLQAQREACEAFIESQRQEGWLCLRTAYDDGGFSGARMDRPALQQLMADHTAGRVDTIVVYKIGRLTRSLADFAKIIEILDTRGACFVSVTQQFNTTTSMGRLTLNVLLSFAQFKREVRASADAGPAYAAVCAWLVRREATGWPWTPSSGQAAEPTKGRRKFAGRADPHHDMEYSCETLRPRKQ